MPPGKSGDWEVREFKVSEQDAASAAVSAFFRNGRFVPAGHYTGLWQYGTLVMSDTPDEMRDHSAFIRKAHGSVLIHGLGLGMVATALMRKCPNVEELTIVEKSSDVIKLTAPTVQAEAEEHGVYLEIIEDDCYTWKPARRQRWDCAWHDVWDTLCLDNLAEMTRLHRRFAQRVGFQDSWGRNFLLAERARQKRKRKGAFSPWMRGR